jgi:hypothetical protein
MNREAIGAIGDLVCGADVVTSVEESLRAEEAK